LRNFAVDICGAQASWVMKDFIQKEIVRIRHLVGDRAQVIGAVSGGVDSTVAATLMKQAIGMTVGFVLEVLEKLNCTQVTASTPFWSTTVNESSSKFQGLDAGY
jgi:NH3-dependent NAD+ synthetase